MARVFLDYTKTILTKVSFDKELFQAELTKALKHLLPYEVYELIVWMQESFKDKPQLQSCILRTKINEHSF